MIIVNLIGGLGNQMFQYAAGRSLAILHNTELKLDLSSYEKNKKKNTPRFYALSHYNINENIASKADLCHSMIPYSFGRNFLLTLSGLLSGNKPRKYYVESRLFFDPLFFSLPDEIFLIGFWQSEKYFKRIEDVIRHEFTLRDKPDSTNIQMSQTISGSNGISIHIRRGDYITNPRAHTHHGVCPLEYYSKAIEFIVEKCSDPHFFIFSDDHEWVKRNLKLPYPHTFMTQNQDSHAHIDMWLMSLCKHHIIANSSFSWWGAWLSTYGNKVVIAPKKWVNDTTIDTSDLIPDEWLTM